MKKRPPSAAGEGSLLIRSLLAGVFRLWVLFTFGMVAAADAESSGTADESRLDAVERRGAQVMPFSLALTEHVFTKTKSGGRQQVVAKDPSNSEQIKLIREHLSKIAGEFSLGDFSDPAKIHGADMPGLSELAAAKPGEIKIAYEESKNGAAIDYSTDNPALVDAIHRWFDAQLRDHARHAAPGHLHPAMHAE